MAKIPTLRRFSVEDFKGEGTWIGKLFDPLNQFLTTVTSALTNQLTHSQNMDAQIVSLNISSDNKLTAGSFFKTGTLKTFIDANVTVATDQIAITAHGFATGDLVQLTSTGVLPAGLALATNYWVIVVDANTIAFASTLANSFAGTKVNITAAAGGGTHTATAWLQMPSYVKLFAPPSFSVETKNRPQGVVIWSLQDQANGTPIVKYGTGIDWNYANGQININHISGLEPSKTYSLVLLVSGG